MSKICRIIRTSRIGTFLYSLAVSAFRSLSIFGEPPKCANSKSQMTLRAKLLNHLHQWIKVQLLRDARLCTTIPLKEQDAQLND